MAAKNGKIWRVVVALALWVCLMPLALYAQEGPGETAPEGETAPGEEGPGEETPDVDVEVTEKPKYLDPSETPWTFEDKGRRDPFTFVKLESEVPSGPTQRGPNFDAVQDLEVAKETARRSLEQAEKAFMEYNTRDCMTFCDQGIDALNKVKGKFNEMPALQDLCESLFRVRLAAERLHNRGEAENDFKNLNIKVTGVVAKRRNSRAIVNNKILGRGDLIEMDKERDESGGNVVIVDEILPGRIIVRFRGFRMELVVSN